MINECRICKSTNLTIVLSLGYQYLSEFRKDNLKPPKYPLDLVMCKNCGQAQLGQSVPLGLLYTDNYGYKSGINETMRSHLYGIVKEALSKVSIKGPVLDIGSNDGTLLKNYNNNLVRVGFDLVPKFEKEYNGTGIAFILSAFEETRYLKHFPKASIITAISMFYDIEDPVAFLLQLKNCLRLDGIIVIQQNYLVSMLDNVSFDNICAEHIFYHSLTSMIKLVSECGLEVFDVSENSLNGGSFRIYLCHKGERKISGSVTDMLYNESILEDDKIYDYFYYKIAIAKQKTYTFIENSVKKNKKVYVLGASTRGNTLLQYYGLDNSLIQKAVERNPEKVGAVIASLGIPIISEEEARKDRPDFMLVLPWFFYNEIVDREKQYVEDGGALIFPLPEFKIITKKVEEKKNESK